MLKKKTIVISLLLMLGIFINHSPAQWRYRSPKKSKGRFGILVHYGNLTGIGLGGSYTLNSTFSLDVLGGAGFPAYIIWASPYSGNGFNLSIRANVHLTSGFYFAVGGYVGNFEISRKLDYVEVPEFMWAYAPIVSVGVELPKKTKRKFGLEVGSAFAIPTKFSRTINGTLVTHTIEADRSESSLGVIFPFFTFFVRI